MPSEPWTPTEPNDGLAEHNWPRRTEHLWSKWETFTSHKKYRVCLHPACHAVEIKNA